MGVGRSIYGHMHVSAAPPARPPACLPCLSVAIGMAEPLPTNWKNRILESRAKQAAEKKLEEEKRAAAAAAAADSSSGAAGESVRGAGGMAVASGAAVEDDASAVAAVETTGDGMAPVTSGIIDASLLQPQ